MCLQRKTRKNSAFEDIYLSFISNNKKKKNLDLESKIQWRVHTLLERSKTRQ